MWSLPSAWSKWRKAGKVGAWEWGYRSSTVAVVFVFCRTKYTGYHLESRIHFRIHSGQRKQNSWRKQHHLNMQSKLDFHTWFQNYIVSHSKTAQRKEALHSFCKLFLWTYAGIIISQATVLMENESLCSTIPRRPRNPLCLQLPTWLSGQDGNEIKLLKDWLTEVERRLEESQNA